MPGPTPYTVRQIVFRKSKEFALDDSPYEEKRSKLEQIQGEVEFDKQSMSDEDFRDKYREHIY